MAAGLITTSLVACLDAGGEVCDDGVVCPPGQACTAEGCVAVDELRACAGQGELAACEVTGFGAGVCRGGRCIPSSCGNGELDPGEVCDDGNTVDGDGCARDCRSDERCGNGVRDAGEACDDGNTTGGDGCQADCALPRCGDGVLDAGELCDDGNTTDGDGCAASCDSDEACGNGVLDPDEECDDGNLVDSDGCQATCVQQRCGDGVVDPEEVCDDGNLLSGDGCAAGCDSDEACGNGLVDVAVGEQCDDGNTRIRDGCAADCTAEIPRWTVVGVATPAARTRASLAYDAARGRVVMFGGTDVSGALLDETWEWTGAAWVQVLPRESPPARADAAMAYAPTLGGVILFGGGLAVGELRDTWRWDGAGWYPVESAARPSVRRAAAMAFDGRRGVVELCGGQVVGPPPQVRSDCWTLDGSGWTEVTTATPSARFGAAMASDPVRGELVLFGGRTQLAGLLADTWRRGVDGWEDVSPGVAPSPRQAHAMAFDAAAGGIVLFGGMTFSNSLLADTWRWDGAAWTASTANGPSARSGHAMAFDIARSQTVLVGGVPVAERPWELAGDLWSNAAAPAAPSIREAAAMADDGTGGLVLFGGWNVLPLGQTWRWFDGSWVGQAPTTSPPAVSGHVMAYAPWSGKVVLFGGAGLVPPKSAETWEWDGADWAQVLGAGPSGRTGAAMAADPGADRLILFGGDDGTLRADTWAYDAGGWTQLAPATSPAPRAWHGLARASADGIDLLLFGGTVSNSVEDAASTWLFDGTTWSAVAPSAEPGASPPTRAGLSLVYDPGLGAAVMTGGALADGQVLVDTWRWIGAGWERLAATPTPTPATRAAAGYDARAGRIVRATGAAVPQAPAPGTTWFGFAPGTTAESCAAADDRDGDLRIGCDDDDCWGRCTPACAPLAAEAATCDPADPALGFCGDGVVAPLEDCHTCPDDVGPCTPVCGDGSCAGDESVDTCPGDCP
ncbi:MAG: DUF4215 domain-containing protein [Kofleriaceae bacterium]